MMREKRVSPLRLRIGREEGGKIDVVSVEGDDREQSKRFPFDLLFEFLAFGQFLITVDYYSICFLLITVGFVYWS